MVLFVGNMFNMWLCQ